MYIWHILHTGCNTCLYLNLFFVLFSGTFHFEFQGFLFGLRDVCFFFVDGRTIIQFRKFDLSFLPIEEKGKRKSGQRWNMSAQCTGSTNSLNHSRSYPLTHLAVCIAVFLILAVEQVQFFVHRWLFLHRADTGGYLTKSALTHFEPFERRSCRFHIYTLFVNIFFLPGTEPVEGNKRGLKVAIVHFLNCTERRMLWAEDGWWLQ